MKKQRYGTKDERIVIREALSTASDAVRRDFSLRIPSQGPLQEQGGKTDKIDVLQGVRSAAEECIFILDEASITTT